LRRVAGLRTENETVARAQLYASNYAALVGPTVLVRTLRQHIERLAIAELEQRKDRLTTNIGQAYLSIAQIHTDAAEQSDTPLRQK